MIANIYRNLVYPADIELMNLENSSMRASSNYNFLISTWCVGIAQLGEYGLGLSIILSESECLANFHLKSIWVILLAFQSNVAGLWNAVRGQCLSLLAPKKTDDKLPK